MEIDLGPNVVNLLEKLANQIGTTSDKIFPWYVKQQLIEGYMFFGALILALIIALIIFVSVRKKAEFRGGSVYEGLYIASWIMFICVFLFTMFGSWKYTSKIMNPEYHAVHEITNDLSKLTGNGRR